MVGFSNKKNLAKKAMIAAEFISIPIALLIIGLTIFFAIEYSASDERTFETLVPDLTYEFPKTVVYSFINYPLEKNDSMTYFSVSSGKTVKDLIWLDPTDSEKVLSKYRSYFLNDKEFDWDKNVKLYNEFSNQKISKTDLIYVNYNQKFQEGLVVEIENGNFYLTLPISKKGDELVRVYFTSDTKKSGVFREGVCSAC